MLRNRTSPLAAMSPRAQRSTSPLQALHQATLLRIHPARLPPTLGSHVTLMPTTPGLRFLPVVAVRFQARADASHENSVDRPDPALPGMKRHLAQARCIALVPLATSLTKMARVWTWLTRTIWRLVARLPHAFRSRAHSQVLQQATRRLTPPQPLSMELDSPVTLTHSTQ